MAAQSITEEDREVRARVCACRHASVSFVASGESDGRAGPDCVQPCFEFLEFSLNEFFSSWHCLPGPLSSTESSHRPAGVSPSVMSFCPITSFPTLVARTS